MIVAEGGYIDDNDRLQPRLQWGRNLIVAEG